jgi:hypothetical protein
MFMVDISDISVDSIVGGLNKPFLSNHHQGAAPLKIASGDSRN